LLNVSGFAGIQVVRPKAFVDTYLWWRRGSGHESLRWNAATRASRSTCGSSPSRPRTPLVA